MNTIFIDMNKFQKKEENKKKKIEHFKNYLMQVSITEDFINEKGNKNISLVFDEKFISVLGKTKRQSFKKFFLKYQLDKIFKNEKKIYFLFSRELDKCKEYKYKIRALLLQILGENIQAIEVVAQNNMLQHDVIYMDQFLKLKKIEARKANILIVMNQVADVKIDKVVEYIKKYRYVDILRMNGVSKFEYQTLLEKVNSINEEYGTTTELIQRRNISEYDIYVFYSDISLDMFRKHYILNERAKILDLKNDDDDTLSLAYRTYLRKKTDLMALFNRVNLQLDRFSKNKLGNWFMAER